MDISKEKALEASETQTPEKIGVLCTYRVTNLVKQRTVRVKPDFSTDNVLGALAQSLGVKKRRIKLYKIRKVA